MMSDLGRTFKVGIIFRSETQLLYLNVAIPIWKSISLSRNILFVLEGQPVDLRVLKEYCSESIWSRKQIHNSTSLIPPFKHQKPPRHNIISRTNDNDTSVIVREASHHARWVNLWLDLWPWTNLDHLGDLFLTSESHKPTSVCKSPLTKVIITNIIGTSTETQDPLKSEIRTSYRLISRSTCSAWILLFHFVPAFWRVPGTARLPRDLPNK